MRWFLVLLLEGFGARSFPGSGFALNRIPEPGQTQRTKAGMVKIEKQLGKGSFGVVFKAELVKDGRALPVAFKIEKPTNEHPHFNGVTIPADYTTVSHEFRIMDMMKNVRGFPMVYAGNFQGQYKYYVMQLLGTTLGGFRKKLGGKLPSDVLAPIALQILNRLEELHKRGYLMYDIHTGNFMLDGNGDNQTLYAIDLGMAFRYIDKKTGRHVENGPSHLPQNMKNHLFCSLADGDGKAVSRRDELERFLYLMVYLGGGKLPWESIKDDADIARAKRKATAPEICDTLPWLIPAMKHIFALKFGDPPNYAFLRSVFEQKLKKP